MQELSSLTFKVDHTFLDGCEIGDCVQGAEEVSVGTCFFLRVICVNKDHMSSEHSCVLVCSPWLRVLVGYTV